MNLPPSIRAVDTEVGRLFVDARDGNLGKTLSKKGIYEPQSTAWLRAFVTADMHVVDVGANLGYYSVLFGKRVGPGGRVVAWRGAERTLSSNRPLTLLIELWPAGLTNCGSSLDEVLSTLASAGFNGHVLRKNVPELKPYADDAIRGYAARLTGPMAAFNVVFSNNRVVPPAPHRHP